MDNIKDKKAVFAIIFLITLFISLIFQGSRGLYNRDETRYSECAREMLITGSWLVPLRNFEPHLTKPPFTYWTIALGLRLLGINEWGARLPNAIAFSITVIAVGLIAAMFWGIRYGPLASILYLSSIVPFAASNIVTTDTILVMWEVLAVWSFISGYLADTKVKARRYFVVMGIFWGLGFLTKGTAILPVGASTVLFWWIKRKDFKTFPFGLLTTSVFLITWSWWYIIICLKYHWAVDLIIKEQVTGRLFSNEFHRNSAWYAPFYLYLPLVTLGTFPWIFYCIGKLKHNNILRQCKDYRWLFILLWWVIPLLIFSLAKSRLPLYILPVFAPMAIAMAKILLSDVKSYKPLIQRAIVTILILLILKGTATIIPASQDAKAMYKAFYSHIDISDDIDIVADNFLDGLAFYSGKPVEYLPDNIIHPSYGLNPLWIKEIQEIRRDNSDIFVINLKKRHLLNIIKEQGVKIKLIQKFRHYALVHVYSKTKSFY